MAESCDIRMGARERDERLGGDGQEGLGGGA